MLPPPDLTPSQWEAVDHEEGALLVLAGPGSGKTRVITRRIARLIDRGVPSRQILAITFTNKAAREMETRVQNLLPGSHIWVSTFHRLCARLLRTYSSVVGLQPNFTILDTSDQRQLLKQVLSDLDIETTRFPPATIASQISQAKNRMETIEVISQMAAEQRGGVFDAVLARAYAGYQKALLQSNAVDFDDLLLHVCSLLVENPEIRSELDERFRYVLVDEYQDTNLAQYQIIKALSHDYPNLCATGDPDQSIYGWRGAEIGNILRFERDFPNCRVVRLEQNYRSTKTILRAADRLIANNVHRKHKELFTDNDEGVPVQALCFYDEKQEAAGIAGLIAKLAHEEQRPWSDFAIVYRINALSRPLELAIARAGIPYQVAAGVAFYERAEVKDVLSYLRLLYNPADLTAFLRCVNTPPRGIGKTSQARVADWSESQRIDLIEACRQAGNIPGLQKRAALALQRFATLCRDLTDTQYTGVAPLIAELLRRTGYAESVKQDDRDDGTQREDNVKELLTAAHDYDEQHPEDRSLEGFLETTSLVSDTDALDDLSGQVTLMTLHAAKGLEFPVVFISAVEEKILPHERSLNDDTPRGLEEERRLLFVGMTRAEERLYLTRTEVRDFRGQRYFSIPSSFLREMDLEHVFVESSGWKNPSSEHSNESEHADDEEHIPDDEHDSSSNDDAGDTDFDVSSFESKADDAGEPAPPDTDDHHAEPDAEEPRLRRKPLSRSPRPKPPRAFSSDLATNLSRLQETGRLKSGSQLLGGPASEEETSSPFRVGVSVRHPRYGIGTILTASGTGKWRTVTVNFESGDTQKFIVHKAPLQPLGTN